MYKNVNDITNVVAVHCHDLLQTEKSSIFNISMIYIQHFGAFYMSLVRKKMMTSLISLNLWEPD